MSRRQHQYAPHTCSFGTFQVCTVCQCWEGSPMAKVGCRTDWTAAEILALPHIEKEVTE